MTHTIGLARHRGPVEPPLSAGQIAFPRYYLDDDEPVDDPAPDEDDDAIPDTLRDPSIPPEE